MISPWYQLVSASPNDTNTGYIDYESRAVVRGGTSSTVH